MTQTTKCEIAGFTYFPTLFIAFGAVVVMLSGGGWQATLHSFMTATALRLISGALMNRMGDAQTVNAWNDKYHRVVVIVLNSVVGAVLLGRLVYDWFAQGAHGEELAFFATVIVIYSIIAKFTRPNTWGARVHSAFLTTAIAMVMTWVNWPQHVSWIVVAAILALCVAEERLSQLQRRFGWAD